MPQPTGGQTGAPAPKPVQTMAIVGLLLNILVLPGVGSIVGGRTDEGIWQLCIAVGGTIVGIFLTLTIIGMIIGIPLIILSWTGAWIWALITGIQMVQETS